MDFDKRRYRLVCDPPGGNGFNVERIQDFLMDDEFDNTLPHVHSFYEILWFQKGSGKHIVDFVEYEVKPDTIFFLSPGQIHHFDKKSDYQGICIKMRPDFMNVIDNAQSRENNVNNIIVNYTVFHTFDKLPYYTIDNQSADELVSIVRDMELEAKNSRAFGNIDILQSLLRIFLVKTLRFGKQDGALKLDDIKSSHMLFIRFRRMVDKEFSHLHTVTQYAEKLNVSVRTLNKCVNECSGVSPLVFINNRIILEAKRLLRCTDLMVKEIAIDLGYDDSSYFVKFFKRNTGYLPYEFREIYENP